MTIPVCFLVSGCVYMSVFIAGKSQVVVEPGSRARKRDVWAGAGLNMVGLASAHEEEETSSR